LAVELLSGDGNQDINADGNPNLGLDGILGVAVEAFDVEVLFDPFEEEFDTPTGTIELGDGERRQVEVVGNEDEFAMMLGIVETHSTERFWIEERGAGTGEDDGGVTAKSGRVINRSIFPASEVEIGFGSSDEEGLGCLEAIESFEINVSTIHDIVGTWFDGKLIEDSHIVRFALGNSDKTRDAATEIKEGVQFDSRFASPKPGPGKEREAEIDGGRIESVDGLVQCESERLVDVDGAGLGNQDLGEVVKDSPVVNAIGVSKSASRNCSSETGVIAFTTDGLQAGDDVTQAFAKGQLSKSQGEKLISAREAAWPTMATVTLNTGIEIVPRKIVHELGEHELTSEHGRISILGKRTFPSGFWHGEFRSCAPNMIRKA